MKNTVILISLGGTIASLPSSSGRAIAGALSGKELMEKLQIESDGPVEVITLFRKPSNAITTADLLQLRTLCIGLSQREDVAGLVVSQGTDTLEDTAYFLDTSLALPDTAVVVTGAQRVPYAPGSDAGPNLRDALKVAGSPQARGAGALVVFNEEIHAANSVRKLSSYQLNGFGSPGIGPMGFVDGGEVRLCKQLQRSNIIVPGEQLPRVDILPVAVDASPALLEAAVASGAKGLVIDAIGRGHIPPSWVEPLRSALNAGVPVVVTSSTHWGRVEEVYEYSGSLAEQVSMGAVKANHLNARKARLRLMCALSCKMPIDQSTFS
ncbi:MAG: L-asparaginase [Marinobacter maritimus]|jgi:L-asparaginase|uniref:asparaginase n=1 Tax=Marinobacter maritimus TaxID=277961 RepID=UPI000BDC128B|nr:asparaginase [Marinobacter maritimus]MBL1272121.1 asparaginase [Oceanospirillales bacterium]